MGVKAGTLVKTYQILGDDSRPRSPFLSHKKRPKSHLTFLKFFQRRHESTDLRAGCHWRLPKLQRSTHVNALEDVEHVFHMKGGDGETSYARNSRLQRKAILEAKPLLEMAVTEVYQTTLPRTMVVTDLGCSFGPNALLFISEVIRTVTGRLKTFGHCPVEIQFFLNDLPGNDFNHVFRSLAGFHMSMAEGSVPAELPPYYIAGLPGSFYGRLFPCRSVHLFHSSYCLMWCSQVPEELLSGKYVNEGKICIGKTTASAVVKLYQDQFHKDFSQFLKLRSMELVLGGQMVLTILGRKHQDPRTGELFSLYALLAQALQCLVLEGRVKKEKLDGFNLPLYTPSAEEVVAAVEASGLFHVHRVQLFQSNWDPQDDSEDANGVAEDSARDSGENVARVTRAVLEALLAPHFGELVLDELFTIFAQLVAAHLEKERTKFTVIALVLSLRAGR